MEWRAFVSLARHIKPAACASDLERAAARSVISRAYYGAYHSAWIYVIGKGYEKRRLRDHGIVWQRLMSAGRTDDEKAAGALGDSLMDLRHRADYEVSLSDLHRACEGAIDDAKEICRLIGRAVP